MLLKKRKEKEEEEEVEKCGSKDKIGCKRRKERYYI
jgi:hypothetical protein